MCSEAPWEPKSAKRNHQFHDMNPNILHFLALSGAPFLEPFWALDGDLESTFFFTIFSFCQNGFWGPKGGLLEDHRSGGRTFGWARRNAQGRRGGLGRG